MHSMKQHPNRPHYEGVEGRMMKGKNSGLHFSSAHVLFCIIAVFCISILISACTRNRPPDLGYFTQISALSVSPDGNQILFDGCGHKDYKRCTIYRFDRSADRLYRYIHQKESEQITGGRYAMASSRFIFLTVPLDEKKKPQLEDVQIALTNDDGTGFRQITEGKGVKAAYMLSYDEKTLVYFNGKKRDKGKTLASDFDLYKIDLGTGKQTQLTQIGFYGVSRPYFAPDGKSIIFGGESTMLLPKYKSNVIVSYPLDGSGINRRYPVPIFMFPEPESLPEKSPANLSNGSRDPKVTKDGSIWFLGTSGRQGFVGHYRRFPDGKTEEIPPAQLGISQTRTTYYQAITWDGKWMAVLNEDRDTRQRSIGMLNTTRGQYQEVTVPAEAQNILIR
jgi:dipeptidyl aminopeptidase/acylaminoacyl peptidase